MSFYKNIQCKHLVNNKNYCVKIGSKCIEKRLFNVNDCIMKETYRPNPPNFDPRCKG